MVFQIILNNLATAPLVLPFHPGQEQGTGRDAATKGTHLSTGTQKELFQRALEWLR